MPYEVDDELMAWLSAGSGASGPCFKTEEAERLLQRACDEAWGSAEGVDLLSRRWDNLTAGFVVEHLTKRFANDPFYPGVFFRSRVEQVIHDLLLEAPPAPVRPAGVNRHGVNLNFDTAKEKQVANKEQSGFAFAFNKTVREKGISAAKPRAGIVTLLMPNGAPYEYPAPVADKLLNECIALGLIH
jgi:hypothetical protein